MASSGSPGKPQSSATRLLQRIQRRRQDEAKDHMLNNSNVEEGIEMSDHNVTDMDQKTDVSLSSQTVVSDRPKPQPRRSILQTKSKTPTSGNVNLSFQPDVDDLDKRNDEVSVGNEMAENLKDAGQEIAADAKERAPDVPPLALPTSNTITEVNKATVRQDEGFVLGITIHQTDPLEMDYHIRHPMVRVHIIDFKVGNYLAKLDKNRPVSSFYETQHSRSDFVLPILTQPYSFAQHRSLVPKWEETIVFNENFYYFSDPSVSTYIVFEVLDYVSASDVSENIRNLGREAGWIKIAWAFLKVVGKSGQQNTGRRCRLQLYRVPRQHPTSSCEAFSWLNSAPRVKYPSTIYVTTKALKLPSQLMPTSRSMVATQGEVGVHSNDNFARTLGLISAVSGAPLLKSSTAGLGGTSIADPKELTKWNRLPGQVCRLPNRQLSSLFVGQMGGTRLCFSNSGMYLAVAGVDPPSCDYPIVICDVKGLALSNSLYGHINVIYDLCWSPNDSWLVSASSDATARLWLLPPVTLENQASLSSSEHIVLAHPSFVYSARFHPKVSTIVATGCHDSHIRIWGISLNVATKKHIGTLLQEIAIGGGLINCLEFDPAGHLLFSGTDNGHLASWHCNVTAQTNHPKCGFTREWTLERKIKAKEIEGTPINRIIRPKASSRLLVHTRDSSLRMYDLASEACTQLFTGHINARDFIGSCITPCGTFVLGASEVGTCFVWNAVTGDVVTIYDRLLFTNSVTDVAFHPHEHMAAFCSYGDSQPVFLYGFDEAQARLEAEYLKRVERGETMGEQRLKLFEPDRVDMDREVDMINNQIASKFAARYDKVNKALTAVAPLPDSSFKQNVVDSLLFGGAGSLATGGRMTSPVPANTMMTSTQFASTPVINFNITEGTDKVQAEIKAPTQQTATNKRQKYLALYDYEPQRADELTLRKGDIVVLLCRESERWWLGENITSGGEERGYFPANYVTATEESRRKVLRTRRLNTTSAGNIQTAGSTTEPNTANNVTNRSFQQPTTAGSNFDASRPSSVQLFTLEPASSKGTTARSAQNTNR